MLLRAEGISKSFGPKQVLKSVDLQIDRGERIGLVGRNGVGKTTLLKVLMGAIKADVGEITLRTEKVCYLPQLPETEADATVLGTIKTPDARQISLAERISELETAMTDARRDSDLKQLSDEYNRLQEQCINMSAFGAEHKIMNAISRVGISEEKLNEKVSELSGGEKTKVFLARILTNIVDADILFLDEPTSHLDIETVEWLEDYLLRVSGAIIIVSHDRYFLDRVISRIMEIEDGDVHSYTGNYSEYVEKKQLEIERMTIAKEKDRTERARQAKIADEMHRMAWFSSTHKTRLKMLERMEDVEGPRKEKDINIKFMAEGKHGRNMVTAKGLRVERGGKFILGEVDFELESGDKVGIFGPNGSGKTTLLLAILSKLPFDGELWVAPGASVGYFAQGHDTLDGTISAEKHLLDIIGHDEHAKARNLLSRFLITGRDADRSVSSLSGGERARVALAVLIAQKRNFLILDEPTNYLDIPSRHAVESALIQYTGSLLVVTHDRYFLDAVCNKIGILRNGRLEQYNCTYSGLKGAQERRAEQVRAENEYIVISRFKEWASGTVYNPDDIIVITSSEREKFRWALENGKLKKASDVERKKKS